MMRSHLSRCSLLTRHWLAVVILGALTTAWATADDKPAAKSSAAEASSSFASAAGVLAPNALNIGQWVADVPFTDLSGRSLSLASGSSQATVVAITSTSCPLSKRYLPTLTQLSRQYAAKGVRFLLVNPVAADDSETMKSIQTQLGDSAIYVFDDKRSLATAVNARTTTDVIVLDAYRTVVYHGAIDDQYGIGAAKAEAKQHWLSDAIEAVLAGQTPEVQATTAPGCTLPQAKPSADKSRLTYHAQVSRLLNQRCVQCHREGGVAPFALETYQEVTSHSAMIRDVITIGTMPPWFAAAPADGSASPWKNDCSLTTNQKETLTGWIDAGMPEGDEADAPAKLSFASGWLIGEPDAIYEFDKPVPIQATGVMPYKHVVVPTNESEDRWVQAIEIHPGDRSVVHHVIVTVVNGEGRRDIDEARDGYWGAYVPGMSTMIYPKGTAKRLPAGAKLVFQMHYTPNGTATTDQTRIGLKFASEPPQYEVKTSGIANPRIKIPPHATHHQETASLRVPFDAQVISLLAHAHLRGKACRFERTGLDGKTEGLLEIPKYDFNWQLRYEYTNPLSLKQGETLRYIAWYDNSDKNPANPDPNITVHWGQQTTDEMHLGYVEYIVPGAELDHTPSIRLSDQVAARIREEVPERIFGRLDSDGNGRVTREELERVRQRTSWLQGSRDPLNKVFDRLDTDQDGELNAEEFSKLHSVLPARREG